MNLLIVDDHPVVLNGTKALLQHIDQWHIEIEHEPSAVLQRMNDTTFQLFLLDINMQPINGIELAQKIKHLHPEALTILYTGYDLADYYDLLIERKVDGLLSKTATKEQVIQTISATLRGELLLPADFLDFIYRKHQCPMSSTELAISEKEQEILQLVARGCTNKAIALEFSVTQRTIENYLSKIFVRLNVESRAEAVLKAKDLGWIH
ncbi:response regulator transcription factor [Solibacillus sp. FSL H8-0538]|uniref:response regulator transcription factor n=1 Tax=Solibacillus sp. FSL H8-0538 TaxID=2921400 RepID=UPI0030F63FAA